MTYQIYIWAIGYSYLIKNWFKLSRMQGSPTDRFMQWIICIDFLKEWERRVMGPTMSLTLHSLLPHWKCIAWIYLLKIFKLINLSSGEPWNFFKVICYLQDVRNPKTIPMQTEHMCVNLFDLMNNVYHHSFLTNNKKNKLLVSNRLILHFLFFCI